MSESDLSSNTQPSPQPGNQSGSINQLEAALSSALRSDNAVESRTRAIEIADTLLESIDTGSRKPEVLESLARVRHAQFQDLNDWDALERAIDLYGTLIQDTDEDDLETSSRLGAAYARCMQDRFMRGRNEEDLEQAIIFATESVERTKRLQPADFTNVVDRLCCNWLCLFTKVHQLDDDAPEDFNKMIKVVEEANSLTRIHDIETSVVIEAKSSLEMTYQLVWDKLGKLEFLYKALTVSQELLADMPSDIDANLRTGVLSNHSFLLQRVYLLYVVEKRIPPDMEESQAKNLFDNAVEHLSDFLTTNGKRLLSGPENTLTFVMYIREFPLEHRGPLLAKCVNVLQESVKIVKNYCSSASKNDQRDCLSTLYGISRYAAAAALQAGKTPYEALVLHEEGKAVALSLQQEMTHIDSIRSFDEELADEYDGAVRNFRSSLKSTSDFSNRQYNMKILAEMNKRIWDGPRVTDVSGRLAEIMLPKIAEDRDIVVINLTDIVSHAIIITKDDIHTVHLPGLDEFQLSEDSWEIQRLLAKEEDQEQYFHDLHTNLSNFLKALWKNLVKPVLEDLGHKQSLRRSDSWPKVTWVPSGILCLYPIHAAGLGLHKEANTMNKVISSYAPSVSSLIRLHERDKRAKVMLEPTEAVIVSMPETAGRYPLDLSVEEAAAIAHCFPNSTVLKNQTTEEVLSAIAKQPHILHFSCHGEVDYSQPLLSKLLMRDWQTNPLTADILQLLDTSRSHLVFLSACFTANAGVENMQDEGNHIAAALLSAGFSNVIGSSWYVGESAALEVIKRFYEQLVKSGDRWIFEIQKALHFALMDFRETTRTAGNRMRGDPVTWAPFSHFGL